MADKQTITFSLEADTALTQGLRYMGTLQSLSASGAALDKSIEPQLNKLFEYAVVSMGMGGRDKHLPDGARRWAGFDAEIPSWLEDTDMKHTVASFGYLDEICKGKNHPMASAKILYSAMICHDCAYPKASSFSDFTSKDKRKAHMINGQAAFTVMAGLVNKEYPGFYESRDIDTVNDIISKHDNPGIEEPFAQDDPNRELLMDHRAADRLWMLDKGGFALDLMRRIIENFKYEPAPYLAHVVSRHIKEAEQYPHDPGFLQYAVNGENHRTIYTTQPSFDIFRRLINDRMKEYDVTQERLDKDLVDALKK